jgi:hypothetical protein
LFCSSAAASTISRSHSRSEHLFFLFHQAAKLFILVIACYILLLADSLELISESVWVERIKTNAKAQVYLHVISWSKSSGSCPRSGNARTMLWKPLRDHESSLGSHDVEKVQQMWGNNTNSTTNSSEVTKSQQQRTVRKKQTPNQNAGDIRSQWQPSPTPHGPRQRHPPPLHNRRTWPTHPTPPRHAQKPLLLVPHHPPSNPPLLHHRARPPRLRRNRQTARQRRLRWPHQR